MLIVVAFHPLGDDEILPQAADIATEVRRIEIVDDGVANSRIHKIDFSGFLQFIPEVPAERPQAENDKRLLQYSPSESIVYTIYRNLS